jgi:hypothetical protein
VAIRGDRKIMLLFKGPDYDIETRKARAANPLPSFRL